MFQKHGGCVQEMKGLVLKSTGKFYQVKGADGLMYPCQIRGKLRLKDAMTTNPVAAGDHVRFDDVNGEYLIREIGERKNYIIRKSVNLSRDASIIASNIDVAFLLVTLSEPETPMGFVDRFLVTAEAYDITSVLLFHKYDQYSGSELAKVEALIAVYENVGYQCLRTSIVSGLNLDVLQEMMKDKVKLFSGQSGAGKSSLINTIVPTLDLRVGEISDWSGKGQHTTTFAEMHELPFGGYMVDTPGIKGFGLVDIPKEELHHHFKEFFRLLPQCKFANCTHVNEPGCAVRKGLEAGTIAPSRYKTYLSMFNDEEEKGGYRRNA